MICVILGKNKAGQFTSFSVQGHADYAASGQDIVCAAVSMLSQTALLGLLKYAGKDVQYAVQEGNLSVTLGQSSEYTQIIIDTMYLGLQELVAQYNQYVEMHIKTSGGGRNV
ncbi:MULTISPECIES: ribosomal-processing cysteine protease Prp [Megasphaera]|jgi:hypothetical protein|uniref:Ribosomal processing cysteine protease Prp n=1 Tax=Megasphaera hutchinsoni TaxID=1588748 RepID=A0A134CHH0_9FIRM|nr:MULTISPECIES: ribosomal-processing cysteine protease Prp [Megasphaera]EGS35558.1 hypothetical protein HMPREF1040_1331 [Megasphaera sp. UPII 135-E]KXB91673.1 hypothetical protein HMPREF3182_00695 [Megasphaera hutchinsoni]MUP48139.1 ribosomal-processing cysteine protease Prp [Veillonellaceae bacterium M2-8]MUP58423.1 ribosomal-processing cysteine protease Prp [Veillonellaceae bacterium M2-4]